MGDAAPAEAARIVVIYGVAHSGTTILHKLVALHPDTTWFSQYSLRDGTIPGRRRLPLADALDRGLRRLVGYDWHKEERGVRGRVVPRPGEAPQIFSDVAKAGPVDGPPRLRSLVEAQCRTSGRSVLVCKPLALRGLRTLVAAYPGAPLLHIVRDGRAVALSLRARSSTDQSPEEKLQDAARQWCSVVGGITAETGLKVIHVSYEALCEDVHGRLSGALEEAGLDPSRYPFDRIPPALRATNQGRMDAADEADLRMIEDLQRPLLERFGYELMFPSERRPSTR